MYQYLKGDVLILRTYPGIGPIDSEEIEVEI